ncbi:hypothetical protein BT69DRAFT_512910 [Atractiella rhizophila]|nr:hypothetical protein BT69DRAFT_512910 [Atractiella rhizophila]
MLVRSLSECLGVVAWSALVWSALVRVILTTICAYTSLAKDWKQTEANILDNDAHESSCDICVILYPLKRLSGGYHLPANGSIVGMFRHV